MRLPLRWRIRTGLAAVFVLGLVIGVIALRHRSERLMLVARGYAAWDGRISTTINIMDRLIRRRREIHDEYERAIAESERGRAELDRKTAEFERKHPEVRLSHWPWSTPKGVGDRIASLRSTEDASHRSTMERLITLRSKWSDLWEYARRQERNYSSAARRPWWNAPPGEPIGPKAESLEAEYEAILAPKTEDRSADRALESNRPAADGASGDL